MRGKLVPQDPNDKPASVLLEKIAKEKKRLIKEGKIKEQKSLPEIEEVEKPFELPNGWRWENLGNFVHLEMGQSPSSNFYNQEQIGIPFFQGKADFGDLFPTPRYWCTQPTKYSYPGDILLSVRAPVGPTNVSDSECCIGRGLAALRPLSSTNTKYILYFMRAFQKNLEDLATGTTFAAVSKTDVETFLIAIPPLAEQHRIVAKVDELMALCDTLKARLKDAQTIQVQLADAIVEQAVGL
ncbi:MAG: restriction endonuclease subunit S [Desulfobacteria bacterium]